MIDRSELRKGIVIELEGRLYSVLDYQHIKMGRGTAQLRLKLRDVRAGHTIERTFQADEKFNRVRLDRRNVQFLYQDGDLYYFMDVENFEQFPVSGEQLGNALNYLKDGMTLDIMTYDDEPISAELPLTVELQVTETGPGFKGDTATGGTKPAILETGITVQVPFFVNSGDIIKVDTRTGTYVERASSR